MGTAMATVTEKDPDKKGQKMWIFYFSVVTEVA